MADFADAQRRAWANKVAKGFNTTDVPMEFMLLVEEAGEAFSAWRKDKFSFGGELADIAIFLLGIAEMTDVDLGTEVEVKLAANEARAYVRLPNGTPVKAEAQPPAALSASCAGCGEQFADSETGEYEFATRERMERLLNADGWTADPVLCRACQPEPVPAGQDTAGQLPLPGVA